MIIIEGPDGAGKTTLVNRLAESLDLKVGKRGTADRDRLYEVTVQDTFRALQGAVQGYPPILWDRLYYSELVYHPYTTGTCAFSARQQVYIEHMIDAMNVPVVLCMPPEKVVIENVLRDDRHEMKNVKDNIKAIYHGYEVLYRQGRFPGGVFLYDYTRDKLGPLCARLSLYINIKKELVP